MRKAMLEEKLLRLIMVLATAVVLGSLLVILVDVVRRGVTALSPSMLIELPRDGGRGGGLLNAIVGSLYISTLATLFSASVGVPAGLYIAEFEGKSRIARTASFVAEVLSGVPSIIFGVYGFVFFVIMLNMGVSLLAGALTLAYLELPIIIKATEETVKLVPSHVKEAALSLGATRWEVLSKVTLRQASPGIATAVLLAFARGAGEAAPLMFTSGYSNFVPSSLLSPAANLPLAVYYLIMMPFPEAHKRAFAAAFILTMMVLSVNWSSRIVFKRWGRYVVK
ncbi:MAG: phosphate ABC transporter permease PtsA [Thermoprotei archaeon]|nr:MAG: phosphate ABC transporter permease PtsA [Thermoprotei archaeon]